MHMLPFGMRDPHPLSRSIKKRHSLLGGPFEFNKRSSSSKISRVMLVFGLTVVPKMKMFGMYNKSQIAIYAWTLQREL